MKQKLRYILLFCSVVILSSFMVHRHNADEDAAAYIFCYISVKNPTLSKPASVFSQVYAITVKKDDYGEYAKFGMWDLEKRLRKYIEGEMGKELISPLMTCCFEYYSSSNEASEERSERIADERRKRNEILYPSVNFGFSWDWKKDIKD